MSKVIKDHLKYQYSIKEEHYVETRCEILTVEDKNPTETYHMKQLDRRWENDEEKKARGCNDFVGEMVFDKDKGAMGASANDANIISLISSK